MGHGCRTHFTEPWVPIVPHPTPNGYAQNSRHTFPEVRLTRGGVRAHHGGGKYFAYLQGQMGSIGCLEVLEGTWPLNSRHFKKSNNKGAFVLGLAWCTRRWNVFGRVRFISGMSFQSIPRNTQYSPGDLKKLNKNMHQTARFAPEKLGPCKNLSEMCLIAGNVASYALRILNLFWISHQRGNAHRRKLTQSHGGST